MVPPGNATSLSTVISQNQALPNLHGSGPVEVSIGGFPTPLDHRVIGTARAIANLSAVGSSAGFGGALVKGGDEGFGFNVDYLQGGQIGMSECGFWFFFVDWNWKFDSLFFGFVA